MPDILKYLYLEAVHQRSPRKNDSIPGSDGMHRFGGFCRRILDFVSLVQDDIILNRTEADEIISIHLYNELLLKTFSCKHNILDSTIVFN